MKNLFSLFTLICIIFLSNCQKEDSVPIQDQILEQRGAWNGGGTKTYLLCYKKILTKQKVCGSNKYYWLAYVTPSKVVLCPSCYPTVNTCDCDKKL